ncbi:MAG: photosystem II reaction center PsbP family protein [Actinobacteria bacterium]|nr:photosystem II reaction center PsbP family protein [Actinomycetota bacterium]
MTSTPIREPDPPDLSAEPATVEAARPAQPEHGVAAAPAASREALQAQPADAAERVEQATALGSTSPGRRRRSPRQGRHRRWTRWLLAGGAVVVAAIGVGLWLTVMVLGGKSPTGLADPADAAPTFVPYRDPQGRFSISYPSGWLREPSSDSQAVLLLRTDRESQNSMLVRIVPLDEPVGPEQLAEARKLTDSLVQASDVNVVVARQITLNGVPGYYYLYTFGEPGSDRFGLHAHYFLFSGSTMHVLVFQALPDTEFVGLAPDFDAIARSYRVG